MHNVYYKQTDIIVYPVSQNIQELFQNAFTA